MGRAKRKYFSCIVSIICTFIIITSISFLKNKQDDLKNNPVTNQRIAAIKKVSSGQNTEGYPYQTYSFEIKPSDSTYKDIKVKSIKYVSPSSDSDPGVESVLEVIIDNDNSNFTVIQLKDFKTAITLTFCSVVNENIEASLKIDCKQKWLGFKDPNTYNLLRVIDGRLYEKYGINDIFRSQFYMIEENYSSLYTIPCKEYTYADAKVSYSFNSIYEMAVTSVVDEETYISTNVYTDIRRMNVYETSTEIDKAASKFINDSYGLRYEEFIEAFKADYKTWNSTLKKTALESDYYGFVAKMEVTYSIGDISKTLPLNAYIALDVNDLIVEPKELVLPLESIVF